MGKCSIYTKTGDKGTTSLVSGTRVPKDDARLWAYGTVDELNSHVGMLISLMEIDACFQKEKDLLQEVQHNLFNLASNLACEVDKRQNFSLPKIHEEIFSQMEEGMDSLDQEVGAIEGFILPGGSLASSQAHICRTVCRRLEREMWSFKNSSQEEFPENGEKFINRLSDYFFMIARVANARRKRSDIYWKK